MQRIAKFTEKNEIIKFLKKNHTPNHIFVRDKKFFNWQHRNKSILNIGITKIKKNIICFQAFVPQSHYDKKLSACEIHVTLALSSKNAPIASLLSLFRYIIKSQDAKTILTSGFNPRTIAYNQRLGFKTAIMDHYFLLIKKKNYKIIVCKKNIKQSIRVEKNEFLELKKKDLINNNLKELYQISIPKKSNEFLINRYFNHKIFNYKLYKVFDEQNSCIVVIRIIYLKGRCVIRIIDFIGEENNILKIGKLLKYFEKKYSPEAIDICSYGINKKYYTKLGLLDSNNSQGIIIPDHVAPLEQKIVKLYCGYITTKNQESCIRIMRGDGDRDRPS